jgi:hypothetical protein
MADKRDAERCLERIVTAAVVVEVSPGRPELEVCELVAIAAGVIDHDVTAHEARYTLREARIRLEGEDVLLGTSSALIRDALKGSAYGRRGWKPLLLTIPGAWDRGPAKFGHEVTSRAVAVPLKRVIERRCGA